MCVEERKKIVKELLDRYGRKPLSKTKIVMALHYFMRDSCNINSRNFGSIEEKVDELVGEGDLQEIDQYSYVVA